MKIIAHRGNINGPDLERENQPAYIERALRMGYDAEIDLWCPDGDALWLGHDEPLYEISELWLFEFINKLWVHCKDVGAAKYCSINGGRIKPEDLKLHYFWHQDDDRTLTSRQLWWTFPGQEIHPMAIAVLPENTDWPDSELQYVMAICTDEAEEYRQWYQSLHS